MDLTAILSFHTSCLHPSGAVRDRLVEFGAFALAAPYDPLPGEELTLVLR